VNPLALPGLGLSLLAPWGLAAGALAATALAVLHAITVGRPRPQWLPTARFAPERAPRAVRRLSRPADRLLLTLRVLAALLAGLALARPVRTPERVGVARLVLVDRSRAAAAPAQRAAVRDAVRALVRPGDVVLPFDATPGAPLTHAPAAAAAAWARTLDSALAAPPASPAARGALSAALVAARRAAPALAARADSLELVIVSPLARETVDAATLAVRATWGGRVRLVAVPAAAPAVAAPALPTRLAVRDAPRDDALAAALALDGVARDEAAPVRLVRARATDADREWARGAAGRALVEWPADGRPTDAAPASDSAFALVAGDRAVVAPFARPALPATDSTTRIVARWADGRPAAVERALGAGCARTIAVAVPQVGDAALAPAFRALLPALLGPCGGARDLAPLGDADRARLAGTGPLLAAAPLRAPLAPARDPLGATLLALAAALLLLELPIRRRARRDAAARVADEVEAPVRATREAA
jgi:hypothetical protein